MAYPSFLRVLDKTDLERRRVEYQVLKPVDRDSTQVWTQRGDFPLMNGNYKLKTFLSKSIVTGIAELGRLDFVFWWRKTERIRRVLGLELTGYNYPVHRREESIEQRYFSNRGPLHEDSCRRPSFTWLLAMVFLWHPGSKPLLWPPPSSFASAGVYRLLAVSD